MATTSRNHTVHASFADRLGFLDADVESTDGEACYQLNQHFHEFDGPGGTCECGLSDAAYQGQAEKCICPLVLDALFDPLPVLTN